MITGKESAYKRTVINACRLIRGIQAVAVKGKGRGWLGVMTTPASSTTEAFNAVQIFSAYVHRVGSR